MKGLRKLFNFASFSQTHLEKMLQFCKKFTLVEFEENETILADNEGVNSKMYCVLKGKVGVYMVNSTLR